MLNKLTRPMTKDERWNARKHRDRLFLLECPTSRSAHRSQGCDCGCWKTGDPAKDKAEAERRWREEMAELDAQAALEAEYGWDW